MELADYIGIARRRWWMVVVSLVVCAAAAGLLSLLQAKVYSAEVRLLVPAAAQSMQARTEAAGAAASYAELAMTAPAISRARLGAGSPTAATEVTAVGGGNSPFLTITVASTDPQAAARVANAYVSALPSIVVGLEASAADSAPHFTVLQEATVPTAPVSPQPIRNALIGLALGLVLGVMSALLREALDGRLRDGVQLERAADVVLLGMVPKEFRGVEVPAIARPKSRRSEAYRAVRTNLEFLSAHGMPRSVVVTSAAAGEGKSSLAANLAVMASRAGRNVVVVDADLRKPKLAEYFGLHAAAGLTDVLTGRWQLHEVLQQVPGERVTVLASGPLPAAPAELVGSAAMARLIDELELRYDLVIIDTPPILPVTDGLALAVNVDGVVLVARMMETTRKAVSRAVASVRKVNAELIGVVGNAAATRGPDSEYGYGGGYGYASGYVSKSKLKKGGAEEVAYEVAQLEAGGRRERRQHGSRRQSTAAPEHIVLPDAVSMPVAPQPQAFPSTQPARPNPTRPHSETPMTWAPPVPHSRVEVGTRRVELPIPAPTPAMQGWPEPGHPVDLRDVAAAVPGQPAPVRHRRANGEDHGRRRRSDRNGSADYRG